RELRKPLLAGLCGFGHRVPLHILERATALACAEECTGWNVSPGQVGLVLFVLFVLLVLFVLFVQPMDDALDSLVAVPTISRLFLAGSADLVAEPIPLLIAACTRPMSGFQSVFDRGHE